jgi:DnaJ-class molecular chaperone
MVAVEKTIANNDSDADPSVCPECRGTGTVSNWSDVAYFEDRRVCGNCEAGQAVDSRIGDLVRRAQLEQRLSGR